MNPTRVALFLAVTALPAVVGAQPRQFHPQTDQSVLRLPGMERVEIREGIAYAQTDSGTLTFDLYLPPKPTASPPPVVVFVNGVGDRPGIGMRKKLSFAAAGDAQAKCGDGGIMQGLAWYNAACSYALAGQKERALGYLEKCVGSGAVTDRAGLKRDPDFASLAGDPRFEALATPR